MLEQIAIVLLAAVLLVPLFQRLGFGSVLGYLIAGLALGPWGLRVVGDVEAVLHFSELGVTLLLFVIGLELQPSRLWALRRPVFGLGSAQVGVTAAVAGAIAWFAGVPAVGAAAIGIALSLSSTAYVLRMLAERGELAARHGREAFAILLFQDVAVIPVLALLPIAAVADAAPDPLAAARAIGALALMLVLGRYVLQQVFRAAARHTDREIFTATALLAVAGTAWLMTQAGLSTSLGAFMAGVLLADSEFRHEIEAVLEPFKGLLLGLFFIAVGMSVNLGLVRAEPVVLPALAVGLLALKIAATYAVARFSGANQDQARKLAVALAAGGEFAFVLLALAASLGLLDVRGADALVVVVTLTMMLAPLLLAVEDRIRRHRAEHPAEPQYDRIDDPPRKVVIVGLGRFGQIVGRILRMRGIPFTALDASAEQVDFLRRYGNKVYYGDASRRELIQAAKVDQAALVIVAVGNLAQSMKIIDALRRACPGVPIFARARNRQHCYALMDLGVRWLVRDTLHSSLAMAQEVLAALGDPPDRAGRAVRTFRDHDEQLLREQHAVQRDEAALVQSARDAAEELRRLFEQDAGGDPEVRETAL
ncbi:MAG: monovalent cation:proton antiporter-2 (CPA2) family protein [Gammaproteobacteria bacterium]